MSANPNLSESPRSRIHPLIAAAAVAVIVVSGVGVAALTGILPSSKAVPVAVTAPALLDTQPNDSLNGLKPNAQSQAPSAAPAHPVTHHHYVAPVAPPQSYASNETNRAPARPALPAAPAVDPYAGQVVSVNAVKTAEPTTGLGALGGAVLGGLAGTQIGNGRGRTAATIVGALGGGLAGNTVEHAVHKATTYDVQVRMEDGSYRNFSYQTDPGLQAGQRVHVSGDSLTAS
ncbi:glycine zipper 2TM domain-containing protein [Caballeronia sp. SEWSISQ10-4 2]|uniref:glycine zipper 2TM domain-containing protein n=1 Tax=Caballeronia sp. SEWSISQ10-4 2 TaxID=2937438 RepID=UPI002653F8B4|nr:glycine zipper 2TM domain-containing protein [Caballeronia sp. SEWSISQ10-4 2]MDN7177775.1 glycine zipper 2TM domain-containing protein [Caballeronia sp. SEWSISQ10-4 2]